MIQDIEPVRLDNQYRNVAPDDGDMVFFFEGSYSDYEINKARRLGNEDIKKGRYRKLMED